LRSGDFPLPSPLSTRARRSTATETNAAIDIDRNVRALRSIANIVCDALRRREQPTARVGGLHLLSDLVYELVHTRAEHTTTSEGH
jgi:hypothetical protein